MNQTRRKKKACCCAQRADGPRPRGRGPDTRVTTASTAVPLYMYQHRVLNARISNSHGDIGGVQVHRCEYFAPVGSDLASRPRLRSCVGRREPYLKTIFVACAAISEAAGLAKRCRAQGGASPGSYLSASAMHGAPAVFLPACACIRPSGDCHGPHAWHVHSQPFASATKIAFRRSAEMTSTSRHSDVHADSRHDRLFTPDTNSYCARVYARCRHTSRSCSAPSARTISNGIP